MNHSTDIVPDVRSSSRTEGTSEEFEDMWVLGRDDGVDKQNRLEDNWRGS